MMRPFFATSTQPLKQVFSTRQAKMLSRPEMISSAFSVYLRMVALSGRFTFPNCFAMVILFPQEQAKVNNRKRERARSTFFISPKNKFHLCRPAKRENILIHKIMNRALHGQGNIDGWLGADGFPFRVPP